MKLQSALALVVLSSSSLGTSTDHNYPYHDLTSERSSQVPMADPESTVNGVPFSTRAHWMRRAIQALPDLASPCPENAFGTAIVNHTGSTGLGELVCIGANNYLISGNPTLHGEVAAINNCSAILSDPQGPYKLSAAEVMKAWPDLSLYTNAEPCPMCASAIRWGGFREIIYGTSLDTLIEQGWEQIRILSAEVLQQSYDLPHATRLLGGVLANETDSYFSWQFNRDAACPKGCQRVDRGCRTIDS